MGTFADDAQYCFHVPPLNSIDHLHLHCIASPQEMGWLGWIKYYPDSFWCMTAETAILNLDAQDIATTDTDN